MPLVDISILAGKSPEYAKAVGDAVNAAVIETMGFPPDDRYQIIHEIASDRLQLQERDGDRAIMHLVMRAGRSDTSKQAFYRKVVENLAANPGIPPQNVLITITENHDIDWSFRDGIAQFVLAADNHGAQALGPGSTKVSTSAVCGQAGSQGTVSKTTDPAERLVPQDYLVGGLTLSLIGLVLWNCRKAKR